MAQLATVQSYLTFAGISTSDSTRDASLAQILVACERAVRVDCRPYEFDPVTRSDRVLDAPHDSTILRLPTYPVRSVTSIHYRGDANGVVANFTSDYLLPATAYALDIDDHQNNWSRSGRVERLNRSNWGVRWVRRLGRLSPEPVDEPKSVLVTYVAGHVVPPADAAEAIHLMTSLVYARRKTGAPTTNEAWNGYSVGFAAPILVTAALQSPDVQALLKAYKPPMLVA